MILSPDRCATTVASTAAPATKGVPIIGLLSPPTMSTESRRTVSPTFAGTRSTRMRSPSDTLNCFPLVATMANMAKRPRARPRSLSLDWFRPLVDVIFIEARDLVLVVGVEEVDVVPGDEGDLLLHALRVRRHHELDLVELRLGRSQVFHIVLQLRLEVRTVVAARAVVEDRDPTVLQVVHELALHEIVNRLPVNRPAPLQGVVRARGGRIELIGRGGRRIDVRGRPLIGDLLPDGAGHR